MTAELDAALDVIEASLDEQMGDWECDSIFSTRITNKRTEARVSTDGDWIELSDIRIELRWGRKRRMKSAVRRWSAKKAVAKFRATN